MTTHYFDLILEDTHGILNDLTGDAVGEMAEALFEAGCDDCTPGKSCGVITVGFARDDDSLDAAIISAIQDVHSAGYRVERVVHEDQKVFDRINDQLSHGAVLT